MVHCKFAWKEGCIGNTPSINLFSRRGHLQLTKEWQSQLSEGKNEAEFLTICCKKMQNI